MIVRKGQKKLGNHVGQVSAELEDAPAMVQSPTLGKTVVSRVGGNTLALWPSNRETPAITLGV